MMKQAPKRLIEDIMFFMLKTALTKRKTVNLFKMLKARNEIKTKQCFKRWMLDTCYKAMDDIYEKYLATTTIPVNTEPRKKAGGRPKKIKPPEEKVETPPPVDPAQNLNSIDFPFPMATPKVRTQPVRLI